CLVVADEPYDQFFHIGYMTFPMAAVVKSFSLPLTPEEEAQLKLTCEKLHNTGQDPQPLELVQIHDEIEIAAGQEAVFAEIKGPAVLCQLRLGLDSQERSAYRRVLLKIRFDDMEGPTVLAPLGDFFGQGLSTDPFRSLPMGFDQEAGYCFFRMPFLSQASLSVKNLGKEPVRLKHALGYKVESPPSERFGYFHAGWRREIDCARPDYPILQCRGSGKFIGAALFVHSAQGANWAGGDEKIYIDDERFPSFFGTGSTDYFGALGKDVQAEFENPFHGGSLLRNADHSFYRWHIPDPISFGNSFRFTLENLSADLETKIDYASMAYWYMRPGVNPFFTEPTLHECLPRVPSVTAGALEAESLYADGKIPEGVRVVHDEDLPFELSAGRGLALPGKPGSIFYLPLKVARGGLYRIRVVPAPLEKPLPFSVTINNEPIKDAILLDEGMVLLTLILKGNKDNGGDPLILDYIELEAMDNQPEQTETPLESRGS
ncbi:MAG: glycoside hydrolase family 172 protein, partial [Planctomycetota bacterium]